MTLVEPPHASTRDAVHDQSGAHRPTVSVVVCAYTMERWDDVRAAIDSLRRQSVLPTQIVLVIDHNDELRDRVVAQRWLDVDVIENHHRQGLSGARNSGVERATGELIAFLDDDAVAEPTWLQVLVEAMADPSVVVAGGYTEPAWDEPRPGWFPPEFDWTIGCSYLGMPTAPTAVRNVFGANMLFRAEVFGAVGGFSTAIGRVGKIPVGCEETELCIRIHKRWPTLKVLYVPAARVHHRVRAERATWRYFRSRCRAEGVSKAIVSRLAGRADSLSSEATYVRSVLPKAVLRGVAEGTRGKDRDGLRRSAAIVGGLVATAYGYLRGSLSPLRPVVAAGGDHDPLSGSHNEPFSGDAPAAPGLAKALASRVTVVGALLLSAAVAVLQYLDLDVPVRPALALAFLLFVPGYALVRPLKLDDAVTATAFMIATSIACGIGATVPLAYAGAFSASTALAILLVLSVACLAPGLRVRPQPVRSVYRDGR